MKPTRMWVDPDFKRKLKRMAVDSNMNIIDLTEELAKDEKKRKGLPEFEFKV